MRKYLYPFLPDTLKPPLTVAGKNLRKPHTRQEGQTEAVSRPRATLCARPDGPRVSSSGPSQGPALQSCTLHVFSPALQQE